MICNSKFIALFTFQDVLVSFFYSEDLESNRRGIKVKPLSDIGTLLEILNIFGGQPQYLQALAELK